MVAAIGSASAAAYSGVARTPAAGLEAQLARYQKELADCVNCDSAKTPEGKEQIQAISNKISEVRARIDEIDSAQPAASRASINAGGGARSSIPDDKADPLPPAAARPSDSTVGSIVNLFA
jgi:hypothetical protein